MRHRVLSRSHCPFDPSHSSHDSVRAAECKRTAKSDGHNKFKADASSQMTIYYFSIFAHIHDSFEEWNMYFKITFIASCSVRRIIKITKKKKCRRSDGTVDTALSQNIYYTHIYCWCCIYNTLYVQYIGRGRRLTWALVLIANSRATRFSMYFITSVIIVFAQSRYRTCAYVCRFRLRLVCNVWFHSNFRPLHWYRAIVFMLAVVHIVLVLSLFDRIE